MDGHFDHEVGQYILDYVDDVFCGGGFADDPVAELGEYFRRHDPDKYREIMRLMEQRSNRSCLTSA